MEGEEGHVLHYRLPLKPGRNEFTIVPEEQRIELTYQRISADINPPRIGISPMNRKTSAKGRYRKA